MMKTEILLSVLNILHHVVNTTLSAGESNLLGLESSLPIVYDYSHYTGCISSTSSIVDDYATYHQKVYYLK